jgi:2'-deoxynucleoside 5'-phosphate N-hydrolase
MNIYLAHKYHPDQKNRPLLEELTAVLAAEGHHAYCVVRDVEQWGAIALSPTALMSAAFDLMEASEVVLVEFSEKGVGIGIEAGYAYAKGIPIWVIAPQGVEISETLRGIATRVVAYERVAEVGMLLRQSPTPL